MVFFLVALRFLVFFLVFLSLPWCYSYPLVSFLVNRPPFPYLLCSWWFSSWWFKVFGVFLLVLEPPLVLFLSLGAIFDESNPRFPFFVMLMMFFFLVVLSFQVFFLMFWSFFWCYSFSLMSLLVNWTPPSLLCCVDDGLLLGGFPCVLELPLVLVFSLGIIIGELNPPPFPYLLCWWWWSWSS